MRLDPIILSNTRNNDSVFATYASNPCTPSSRHDSFQSIQNQLQRITRNSQRIPVVELRKSSPAQLPPVSSDDHSRVEPPLPIPNRTVKRSRANDSRDCLCESRSSSDSLHRNPLTSYQRQGVCFVPWQNNLPTQTSNAFSKYLATHGLTVITVPSRRLSAAP